MTARDRHLLGPGPKRILALDGGGVRGIVSLAFLERIEWLLAERTGQAGLRLCDYYDLIGGTSTGSIIATGLALGYSVDELIAIYRSLSEFAFKNVRLLWLGGLLAHKFPPQPLMAAIERHVGHETLGSDKLRTGLAIVAKRLDTGSVWVLHNHPRGKFFGGDAPLDFTPNRDLPLASLIRASTAAPTYFEPEFIEVAPGVNGAFVDGGVSPHNNPALLMVMLATISGYGFNWPMGVDKLLVTSVGTGTYAARYDPTSWPSATGAGVALSALRSLLSDSDTLVQTMMQWMSRCATPWRIDSEIGDLGNDHFAGEAHFHYQRYNVLLDLSWLKDNLGLDLPPAGIARLAQIDQPDVVDELLDIGRKAARVYVDADHFHESFSVPAPP